MNIEIGNFLITSDKYNVMVSEKFAKMDGLGKDAKPTGEFGWSAPTFHGTIELALTKMINLTVTRSDSESFESLIEEVRTLRDEVERVLFQCKSVLVGGAK